VTSKSVIFEPTLFDPVAKRGDPLGRNFERTFSQPLAHSGDAISSYRAGDRALRSGKLKGQMRAVLSALQQNPGLTSAELAMVMDCDRYQPARRLSSLERRGLVRRGRLKMCQVCQTLCLSWWPTENSHRF